jgi:hypothetical protein
MHTHTCKHAAAAAALIVCAATIHSILGHTRQASEREHVCLFGEAATLVVNETLSGLSVPCVSSLLFFGAHTWRRKMLPKIYAFCVFLFDYRKKCEGEVRVWKREKIVVVSLEGISCVSSPMRAIIAFVWRESERERERAECLCACSWWADSIDSNDNVCIWHRLSVENDDFLAFLM